MPESAYDDVSDRLAPLATAPVGVLPGPEAARLRGDQRTRRSRTGLAVAGGACVAVVVAVVATAGSGQDRESAVLAPPPVAGTDARLEAALLEPEDVDAALPGRWTAVPDGDDGPVVAIGGCDGSAPVPFVQDARRGFGGPDAARVEQLLLRYADEQRAVAAFGTLIDSLEACSPYDPATGRPGNTLLGGLPGSSDTRLYGELVEAEGRTPFTAERLGAVVTVVEGLVLEDMPALADAAAAEVAGAFPPGPVPPEFVPACGRPGTEVVTERTRVVVRHADCDLTGVVIRGRTGGATVPRRGEGVTGVGSTGTVTILVDGDTGDVTFTSGP